MTTLAIDTSTLWGSVAILAGEEVLFAEDFVADRSHSATLFTILERALKIAPRPERLAIGLGPGSYAGIRIAIAAGIGLELALGAELVGIPSVAAWESGEYLAVGDARRSTYYWTHVVEGDCVEGPLLLEEAEFRARLAAANLPVYATEPLPGFENVKLARPAAKTLARLCAAGRSVAAGPLEPIYLREPHITQPKKASLPAGDAKAR